MDCSTESLRPSRAMQRPMPPGPVGQRDRGGSTEPAQWNPGTGTMRTSARVKGRTGVCRPPLRWPRNRVKYPRAEHLWGPGRIARGVCRENVPTEPRNALAGQLRTEHPKQALLEPGGPQATGNCRKAAVGQPLLPSGEENGHSQKKVTCLLPEKRTTRPPEMTPVCIT